VQGNHDPAMDAGELLWIPLRVECPDGLTDQIRGVTYVQSEIVALCFKPIHLIPCYPRLSATDLDGDVDQEGSRVGSRQWRRFAPLASCVLPKTNEGGLCGQRIHPQTSVVGHPLGDPIPRGGHAPRTGRPIHR